MKNLYLILSIMLMFSACSSKREPEVGAGKTEFDMFCEQLTKLADSADFSELSSEDRAVKLDALLVGKLELSSDAYIAWTAIRHGPPSERYFLYQEAASSTGQKNWNCPAAEQHSHQVGSAHD